MPDASGACDDHLCRRPKKQPMLDAAGPRVKFGGQHRRLPHRAEGAVEN